MSETITPKEKAYQLACKYIDMKYDHYDYVIRIKSDFSGNEPLSENYILNEAEYCIHYVNRSSCFVSFVNINDD